MWWQSLRVCCHATLVCSWTFPHIDRRFQVIHLGDRNSCFKLFEPTMPFLQGISKHTKSSMFITGITKLWGHFTVANKNKVGKLLTQGFCFPSFSFTSLQYSPFHWLQIRGVYVRKLIHHKGENTLDGDIPWLYSEGPHTQMHVVQ